MALCTVCQTDLPYQTSACQRCAYPLPDTQQNAICGQCLKLDEPRINTICGFQYERPIVQLIADFKFKGDLATGTTLSRMLGAQLNAMNVTQPDFLVPVPLHWSRLGWRGFNQSIIIGKQLSQQLDLPLKNQFIKRCKRTAPQTSLGFKARQTNLNNAFQIKGSLQGERVGIIDDIYTTGGTTRSLARLLLTKGAHEVFIWCLARATLG